jgi:hypothetical protein
VVQHRRARGVVAEQERAGEVAGAFDGYGAGFGFDLGEGVDELFAAGCDGDGAAWVDRV